jgi:glycosyltransferase involved in cell wall biosynthesis
MDTPMPTLTICIATYNRAGYIAETLDSIIPQLTDNVELLVVDGASTDNTQEIITTYVQKHQRIRYERLLIKGGVDQDYCRAVELARGEYCWLFTDDDLLKPRAVETVLDAIAQGFALIFVNAEVRDPQLKNVLEPKRMRVDGNKEYAPEDMERLFLASIWYLSFIGAVVIRRSLWLSREREKYYGTCFIHVGVIFQERLAERTLIIAEPYIIIRYGNAQWNSRAFEIMLLSWPKLLWSFIHISDAAKKQIILPEPWQNLATVALYRALGQYSYSLYHKIVVASSAPLWMKLGLLVISFVPRSLMNAVVLTYCKLRGKRTILLYYNLYFSSFNKLRKVIKW